MDVKFPEMGAKVFVCICCIYLDILKTWMYFY